MASFKYPALIRSRPLSRCSFALPAAVGAAGAADLASLTRVTCALSNFLMSFSVTLCACWSLFLRPKILLSALNGAESARKTIAGFLRLRRGAGLNVLTPQAHAYCARHTGMLEGHECNEQRDGHQR